MEQSPHKKQSGQIIIVALIFMAVTSTAIVALVGYAGLQIRSHRQAVARTQALSIAEAGIEQAIWKLNNQPGYPGENNTAYSNGTFSITLTNMSASTKLIRADAYVPNASNPVGRRSVQVTATIGTTNIGFNYGVQAGEGGFSLDPNSRVNGNLYSNGPVVGTSGNVVAGDVIAGGPTGTISQLSSITGNSWSHTIQNSNVGGNASHYNLVSTNVTGNANVHSMSNCSIGGNASYNTQFNCTIGGTATTPNSSVPLDPAQEPLPIDDAQINTWEQDAQAGGVIGSQTISGTVPLGPIKIDGNLTLNIDAELQLTGTVWVTGNLTVNNNARIRLSPSYGSLSGLIIVGTEGSSTAGTVNLQNNVQICGSGIGDCVTNPPTPGSYTMILSQKTGIATPAIQIRNNVQGAIFYAGTGEVRVSNNGGGNEITAYKVFLDNNAVVNYETGLANSNFTSGPGGGWEVADQTWQLLQ